MSAPTQYGPHAAAIAVDLCLGQHLPVERTAGLLGELFGAPMSTGTVAAWTHRAAAGLEPFAAAARTALAGAELVHVDETGLRVAGRGHWLHVATERAPRLRRLGGGRRRSHSHEAAASRGVSSGEGLWGRVLRCRRSSWCFGIR